MMDQAIANYPPPEIFRFAADAWTQPYWDAAREHRLTVCRCGACGRFRMPPTPFCPSCRSQAVEWPTLSGRGVLYSFTVVQRPIIPAMAAHVPYVPAIIELPDAGGVRLLSNIVEAPLADIRIGAEVEALWEDLEAATLVRFRLAAGQDRPSP